VKINWSALALVSVVSLVATIIIVTISAIGVSALATAQLRSRADQPATRHFVVGYTCLALAGLAAAFGIYLIVPFFH
jgi:hypothetical protein